MHRVTVIICHNCRLYRVPVFIAIIAFSGWIVKVCQEAHVSLVLPHHNRQVTPGPYSNVTKFQSHCLGSESLSITFLCSLTVPQQVIFFWAKSSNRSGEEKNLSIYSLWPNPSTPLVRLVTVAVTRKTIAKVVVAPLRSPTLVLRDIYPRRSPNPLRFLIFHFETAHEPISHTKHHHVALSMKTSVHLTHKEQNLYWMKSKFFKLLGSIIHSSGIMFPFPP